MKRSVIILAVVIATVILSAAFISPSFTPSENPGDNIPDSVWAVFEKSCYGCHSDDGNGMARSKLNFDKWDSYSDEKQLKKAKASCNEMKKGGMPPAKFLKNNPDAAPDETEVNIVCNWLSVIEM